MESFRQALRQLGFVEGQNLAIELRYARKGLEQLPELAAELVQLKLDVLTTFGDLTPKIAQQATKTIPNVAISDDIVGAGLVTSLSRPDRNTTGLTIMSPELSAKRLEVLQEMVPGISLASHADGDCSQIIEARFANPEGWSARRHHNRISARARFSF
jgi:putative ABC transport system substrate-binding protein